jgi:7-carboxy-7-deazaguanine synthase
MLKVSEMFYSVQCEGASTGVPAVFIRLQGCNLMCGGPDASLVKEGKATWHCDSELIWRRGKTMTYREVLDKLEADDPGIVARIREGLVHIIWTGGEPTLPNHQKSIMNFIDEFNTEFPQNSMYNEIETNGSIKVSRHMYEGDLNDSPYIQQINCSPKLANSGMAESMRIRSEAIEQIKLHPKGYFKFVISTEADIKEIQDEWIIPFELDPTKIIIMPGVDNRADLAERTRFLFEMSKKYGYRGITRSHILAWDKVTGV